jgi:serine-type D-Ala-D-Ala carboxypeptidase (penicillin-binding protein 5/6)
MSLASFADNEEPRMRKMELPGFCLLLLTLVADVVPVGAKVGDPVRLDGDFATAVVVDAHSGAVLIAKDALVPRQPASMIKMLTELVILERVEKGAFALTDTVTVSARASKMGGSQVYLRAGERFLMEDLLKALTIHSANDAAAALAEHVGGSIEAFVGLMNARARELGMKDSEFHTVNGLPARRGEKPDLTTAYDMSLLARELIKHPKSLEWASQPSAPFRGGEFTLHNPNRLLGRYPGLDGLKTGYTVPAGFCLTATAVQGGARLISVVMGCPNARIRSNETARLLNRGFAFYTDVTLVAAAGLPVTTSAKVKGGTEAKVPLVYGGPLKVTVPRERETSVALQIELAPALHAPFGAGAPAGRAVAVLDGREIGSVPLVTSTAVAKGTWLDRLFR